LLPVNISFKNIYEAEQCDNRDYDFWRVSL
jgi:hypothetical protein